MSTWRHEASQRLPELQPVIASPDIHTPGELWIELEMNFARLCREEPAPIDLLSRIWGFAQWCLESKDANVRQAVMSFFFEEIRDTRRYREVLPQFMEIEEYKQFCGLRAPKRNG